MPDEGTSNREGRQDTHLLYPRSITAGMGVVRDTVTMQGSWNDEQGVARKLPVLGSTTVHPIPSDWAPWREKMFQNTPGVDSGTQFSISSAVATRGVGDIATLTITGTAPNGMSWWSVDVQQLSKDIHTWHQDAEDEDARPDLTQIRLWENTRIADPAAFNQYKYIPGTGGDPIEIDPDSPTRKLAEMMLKYGITNYMVGYPVVTGNIIHAGTALYQLGQYKLYSIWERTEITGNTFFYDDNDHVYGGFDVAGYLACAEKWLLTSLRIVPQADGTFLVQASWMGADKINQDLYPKAFGEGDEPA